MKTLFLSLSLLLTLPAQAAVFDAGDMLKEGSGAVGVLGEVLLSDPTSEGIEVRSRYGLSEEWNLGAVIGAGSKGKGFRFGAEGVYNVLPDWEGQVGFSLFGGGQFLRRTGSTGLQMRIGPMGHKKFITPWNNLPATVYLAIPLVFEARSGFYTTGSQVVLGSLFDLSEAARFYGNTEIGVKLAKSESYVVLGIGARLGELRFYRREGGKKDSKEFTDADFK